jgi:hypothetical protein
MAVWSTGFQFHANSAWYRSCHMIKWVYRDVWTLSPDVPDDLLLHRLFPPNVQVIIADKTEGSLNSALQTRGKILQGYFPAYHSLHLPFDDRRHSRTTRVNRGALAPGCFTAGIPNSVARMSDFTNALITEFAAAAPLTTLAAPRNLLVPWQLGDEARNCTPPCCH